MRFKRLKLAAFLSFKEKTEIDFAQFGNQLILLFGGSGVGKTAIFDGITFALYGRGSGKDRCAGKVEDYHSDFAKEQDERGNTVYHAPMVAELEFEHDGKDYVVSREIKWGENGKNKGFTYEMELQCEGVSLASDTKKASNGSFAGNFEDKVSAYIKGMLGLNAEQFSQVVILAQGEFAKFLNANAQEREDILTKLVDNEGYVDFQLRLREMKNYLKRVIDGIDAEIEQHLNILRARPTISEAEKQQYIGFRQNQTLFHLHIRMILTLYNHLQHFSKDLLHLLNDMQTKPNVSLNSQHCLFHNSCLPLKLPLLPKRNEPNRFRMDSDSLFRK